MSLLEPSLAGIDADPAFGPLKQHIIDRTGLAYYVDKDAELATHIARRLAASRVADCRTYLDHLLGDPAGAKELDALTASLTIGETFFFRHQECFDALRDTVLPDLIDRQSQQRRLRIWSAGCAIGAEPYSLAILLRREFAAQLAGWDVSIVATDINRQFLARAERGEFVDWTLRKVSDDLKAACFDRQGDLWVIKQEYRREILFQYHNLVQHPFPSLVNGLSAFDLILCRNVMIYFEPTIVRQLVGQFRECLVEGGWFVVGPAEPNVEIFRAFRTVSSPDVVLYQKARPSTPPAWTPPDAAPGVTPPSKNGEPSARTTATLTNIQPQTTGNGRTTPAARLHRPSHAAAVPPPPTLADVRVTLNRGQSAAAEECCRKLLTSERLNPWVHYYHALVAEQQGRHGESEQALRRAIYLDRDFVLAHYHLGLVLQRNRDARAAGRSFRNVLVLLDRRDQAESFADADGLTVEALRQLTQMHLEVFNRL